MSPLFDQSNEQLSDIVGSGPFCQWSCSMFQNLKIGQRLGIAFTAIVLTSMISSLISRSMLLDLSSETDQLVNEHMDAVGHMNDIKDNLSQAARSSRNLLLMSDAKDLSGEREAIQKAQADNTQAYADLDKLALDKQTAQKIKEMEGIRKQYNETLASFLKQLDSDPNAAKAYLFSAVRPMQITYMKAADALIDSQIQTMKQTALNIEHTAQTWAWMAIVVVIGSAGIAGALAWYITRSVTQPLDSAVKIANAVAQGDLTQHIEIRSQDEIGALLQALQTMRMTLQDLIRQLKDAAAEIATGSTEIAKGNLDLSHRTEQQAANLQETAASMEQLSSTVRQSTEASQEANDLASQASQVAAKGATVMQEVVQNMDDIAASSRKIGDIISVIDGIAFQTNILALNAAVEAARAGEQGRGFAVVAGEVRTLAQRSANAAKEIKGLITASVEKVDSGTALVGTAGDTMRDIETQINRVASLIGEITSSSVQQNGGIQQVHLAVNELDKVTQQNAALVEESAAAAESLKTQADQLTQSVQTFRV